MQAGLCAAIESCATIEQLLDVIGSYATQLDAEFVEAACKTLPSILAKDPSTLPHCAKVLVSLEAALADMLKEQAISIPTAATILKAFAAVQYHGPNTEALVAQLLTTSEPKDEAADADTACHHITALAALAQLRPQHQRYRSQEQALVSRTMQYILGSSSSGLSHVVRTMAAEGCIHHPMLLRAASLRVSDVADRLKPKAVVLVCLSFARLQRQALASTTPSSTLHFFNPVFHELGRPGVLLEVRASGAMAQLVAELAHLDQDQPGFLTKLETEVPGGFKSLASAACSKLSALSSDELAALQQDLQDLAAQGRVGPELVAEAQAEAKARAEGAQLQVQVGGEHCTVSGIAWRHVVASGLWCRGRQGKWP